MTTILSALSIWTGSTNVIDPGTGELRSSAGQLRRVQLAAAAVLSRPGRCTRQHYTFSAVPLTTTHHPHPRYINPGSLSWRRQRGCRGAGVNKYCLLTISQHIVNISHSCHHNPSHPTQCDGAVCDRQLTSNNRYCLLTRARGRRWWG